jgi:phage shock protein E
MSLFSLFGGGKLKSALLRGAVVIDIRSPNEFDRGKVPDSVNIPMDRFAINTERMKNMNRPLIICSNSVYESGIAVRKLKSEGIKDVYNGGTWINMGKIQQKL